MSFRSRRHFLHILYEYLLRVRADYDGVEADENARIAYMLHNLPSLLTAEEWTKELSEAAWGELKEQGRFKRVMSWLEHADEEARKSELSDFPLSPDGMLKMHELRRKEQDD